MKVFRLFPLLAVFLFLGAAPFAGTQRLMPARDLSEIGETSPVHHDPPSHGPIVMNIHFTKQNKGSANVIVNPDGTYLFSGQWKTAKKNRDFEIVVALKSKTGAAILFHYVGSIRNGGVQWSKQGRSAILQDDFKIFSGPHDWVVSYKFPLDPVVRKELAAEAESDRQAQAAAQQRKRKQQEAACAFDAKQGVLQWLGYVNFCAQFNSAW